MSDIKPSAFKVVDINNLRGTIDLTVIPSSGSGSRLVLVRFDDGSQVFADAGKFIEKEEGVFTYPGSFAELIEKDPKAVYGNTELETSGRIVIPVLAEQLKIAREKVLTGGVRVHKRVSEHTEIVTEPTLQENVNIERIPINKYVEKPPEVRQDGDVTVIPVLEEVVIVEKRLVLLEEIRITKTRTTIEKPQEVVLRREEATVENIETEKSLRNDISDSQNTRR